MYIKRTMKKQLLLLHFQNFKIDSLAFLMSMEARMPECDSESGLTDF